MNKFQLFTGTKSIMMRKFVTKCLDLHQQIHFDRFLTLSTASWNWAFTPTDQHHPLNPQVSPITNQCMPNIHSCSRAETLLPSPKKKIHGKKALFTHHSPMSLLKVWSWWWWQNYSGRVTCFDIYPAAILLLPRPWSSKLIYIPTLL